MVGKSLGVSCASVGTIGEIFDLFTVELGLFIHSLAQEQPEGSYM